MYTTYRYEVVSPEETPAKDSVSLLFRWAEEVRAIALREGQSLTIGRDEPAHVRIPHRSLSRTHARLELVAGAVRVEDLGSTNGTLVDGKRVTSALVTSENRILLGGVELNVLGRSGRLSIDSDAGSLALLEHELRRAQYLSEPFALFAIRHGSTLIPERLAPLLRPIDLTHVYAPNVTLVYLVRAREAEAEHFGAALSASCSADIQAGAVLSASSAQRPDEIIARALDAASRARSGAVGYAPDSLESASSTAPLVRAPNMLRLHELLTAAARTTIPVLIEGETGSGKESLARAVHDRSPRASAPFVAINCAALPAALITSTLFGHERGAFTGADRRATGLFEQANGGTLFLDEVAELSPDAQAALLRVLETGAFVRVGGTKETTTDVRVVAATHRDLGTMVQAGAFRSDLLYRLDAFTLRVPPLRERVEEIAPLAEHFLAQSRHRWGSSAVRFAADAQAALLAYAWPGNVRQLRNAVERAATVCSGPVVEVDHLPDFLFEQALGSSAESVKATSKSAVNLNERLRNLHVAVIREALQKSGGNQSQAARLLGVPRRTLANRIHALGLVQNKW